jgi:hypothetical protein
MTTALETKYGKRIQSRASSHGFRISLSDARQYYLNHVAVQGTEPTEDDYRNILIAISNNNPATDLVITETSNQSTHNQETTNMSSFAPVQASEVLNTSSGMIHQNKPQHSSQDQLTVTHTDIQYAVEQQFGRENQETKQAILNYVAQDTYATAQELQTALAKLRSMRLDILLKLISDYNEASKSDESLLKTALSNASAQRQKETDDFFVSFESQLAMMRNTFGV